MSAWLIVDLDPVAARRAGLPVRVAVPADADPARVTPAELVAWAGAFADDEPEHPDAPELRRTAAKQRLRERVERALAERRWEDALGAADDLLAVDPDDAPVRINRAAALRELGEPAAALAELDRVGDAFAGVALYHRNRGRVLEDLGDEAGAVAAYREALDATPGDQAVVDRLRELGALTTVSGPEGPVEVDRAALADLVRRDLAAHGDDHAHLAGAARALLAEGQPDLAATAAGLALALDDADEATRLVLVEALLAADRPGEARAAAERHVEAEPASALGHELLALACAAAGDRPGAVAAARRAVELDPGAARAAAILAG